MLIRLSQQIALPETIIIQQFDRSSASHVGGTGKTDSASGDPTDGGRDIRRRDALLLDAVAEMQDTMAAQQVVMENAFAAQSKMLGDVIHGCWVRPKPGEV